MTETKVLEQNIEGLLRAACLPDDPTESMLDSSRLMQEVRIQRLARQRDQASYGYACLCLAWLFFISFAATSSITLLQKGAWMLVIANVAASPLAVFMLLRHRRMVRYAQQ